MTCWCFVRPVRMTVTFHKLENGRPHSWWEARRATGGRFRGGYSPIGRGVLPHDLVHMAAEAEFGLEFGFWGLLARGATFRRGTSLRRTRPGRAIIAAHRSDVEEAESLGNAHHHAWRNGRATPLQPLLDSLATAWSALPDGGALTIEWPAMTMQTSCPSREEPTCHP